MYKGFVFIVTGNKTKINPLMHQAFFFGGGGGGLPLFVNRDADQRKPAPSTQTIENYLKEYQCALSFAQTNNWKRA